MAASPEELRSSRSSYAVVLRGIIKDLGADENPFFFLMEGKDADYYRPRIGSVFAGSRWKLHYRNCKGKKNMKPLLSAVLKNPVTQQARILFFFDRDYENDLHEIASDLSYVTDGYSIENHYSTRAAFSEICSAMFFYDIVSGENERQELDNIAALYDSLHTQALQSVTLFNQWAWYHRHYPSEGNINLDDFSVASHLTIDIDVGRVQSNYTLEDLNALAPDRKEVDGSDCAIAAAWFAPRSAVAHYRGKQERDFVFDVLTLLNERASAGNHPFSKVRKARKRLSRTEFIGDLSPLAETPVSLIEFLTEKRVRWEAGES
jgi:hypothetical protein